MLIKRLYLRNFRVFEDELDLEMPPGLVGIHGANGAGKSTLLEAILWTLWGRSRTTKEQVRSTGVGGDCVTEVEFEHEGHLYLVRRTLRGINSTVSVEAHCDGALMSTGTRDAQRYVESVLGMDDGAFRASVFTEQKQLAAFSNQTPAERRRLVLQLLGITPLDAARDAARRDARERTADHERLRNMLPDLGGLETEAADALAMADAARVAAEEEATAATAAEARAASAATAFEELDRRRQEHDALVIEGRAARSELDAAVAAAAGHRRELDELQELAGRLPELEPAAAGLTEAEALLEPLSAAAAAAQALELVEVPPEPAPGDETGHRAAEAAAGAARESTAAAAALLAAARQAVTGAEEAVGRSSELAGEGDCPLCGQALGDAFEQVQAHRTAELERARSAVAELTARLETERDRSRQAEAAAAAAATALERARRIRADWEAAARRRQEASDERERQWSRLLSAAAGRDLPPTPPGAEGLAAMVADRRKAVAAARSAQVELSRLRGRLEGRPRVEAALAAAEEVAAGAGGRVDNLREKVRALGFRAEDLAAAKEERDRAAAAARHAAAAAQQAQLAAATAATRAEAAAGRLADGRAQHAQLSDLASDARHRSRVADLLGEFRNTVVASVGPRLATHAADLFGELTDHEYDALTVDPETYQLQISDGGLLYGLDRFSGSEIDLANLALRVAISEHIHFQSGGSVGLLVLDEVFGPLDDDRKARMLLALERLKGRFRQVLVVTHDADIKEQLPAAIEVLKRPGRRATARVVGD